MTPKAYTKEKARIMMLKHMQSVAEYWANLPNKTNIERCEGLLFSILVMFDGGSGLWPAMNISMDPHPDDMEYHQSQGENWFEPDMVINDDCQLHELFSAMK